MKIKLSISEAEAIIEMHFRDRGYFLNYDDALIKFKPLNERCVPCGWFVLDISLTENKRDKEDF